MPPIFKFTPGLTALITGGASGVGLAVARLCRAHGMRVALADTNAETLALAKKTLASVAVSSTGSGSGAGAKGDASDFWASASEEATNASGTVSAAEALESSTGGTGSEAGASGSGDVETYQTDVSQLAQWGELKRKVESRFGGVDFLMLNAGIGANGGWEDSAYFEKIMQTNLFGVIYGLNTFVPSIRAQSEQSDKPSAIVITGSKQGITNPPGNPAYNASKAAVKTLAEHLSFDLRETRTSVHLLVPGWTFTGLSGGGPLPTRQKPAGAWTPEQVADFLYQKMGAGQFYAICPDNDVSEETDKKRVLWTAGDIVQGRPPVSRWREEWKGEAERWMGEQKI